MIHVSNNECYLKISTPCCGFNWLLKTTFKNNLKHIVSLISDFNGSQNKTC